MDSTVMLGANRLIPLAGKATVAHSTRNRVLDLLERAHKKHGRPRTMIVDITALVWNHDTYAVVGGTPEKIAVRVRDRKELLQHVSLEHAPAADQGGDGGATEVVGGMGGFLVPVTTVGWPATFLPSGASLSNVSQPESGVLEFVFEPKVDPNNDRLEAWEQLVTGPKAHLETNRARVASGSIRNIMRFYELDKVICWDLTWGVWEATRLDAVDEDGFPCVAVNARATACALVPGKSDLVAWSRDFNALATPITTEYLKTSLLEAQGYYLQVGVSVHIQTHTRICVSICLAHTHASVYPSVYILLTYISIHLSISLSICLHLYPSVYISIHLSISLSICLYRAYLHL